MQMLEACHVAIDVVASSPQQDLIPRSMSCSVNELTRELATFPAAGLTGALATFKLSAAGTPPAAALGLSASGLQLCQNAEACHVRCASS